MTQFLLRSSTMFRACLVAVAISLTAGCSTPSDPSPTASTTALDGPGNAPSQGGMPASGQATGGATQSGGASVPTATTGR